MRRADLQHERMSQQAVEDGWCYYCAKLRSGLIVPDAMPTLHALDMMKQRAQLLTAP